MKNRRGFMAALGAGAGAFLLGLPATAQAWGRRRRLRGRCNQCGACECVCGAEHAPVVPYATSCTCCCPLTLYGSGNGVWYYYCQCCPSGNAFAPSGTLFNQPYPQCNTSTQSQCIGSACSKSPSYKLDWQVLFGDLFLDPKAKDSQGNFHAIAFMKGIDKPKKANLKDDKGNDLKPVTHVTYEGRFVALYEITKPITPKPLCIGIQVNDDPGNATAPHDHNLPDQTNFPHYHQVHWKKDGHSYHVVTAKD